MKLNRSNAAGFTLVEIMIVVSIIGLLVVIAIPNFFKNREIAQRNTCVSNLRVIDTAKQLWGMEAGKASDDEPIEEDLVGFGLYLKRMPICPGGGTYDFWSIGELPTCDFSAGSVVHELVPED
ncbi:MAG TPA: prepilin-type cleavage/methylation domain-containing protein [Verrucomicrobiales bacterium]|nr:prepilin-type cleavage/methylation domain-containing protein [Verrucomicrobiales bacterium]